MHTFDQTGAQDDAALKSNFERDGFIVLKNYLDPGELQELRDRAVPLAQKLLLKEGSKSDKYKNLIKSLHRHDNWFKEHLASGRHVALMRHLLGNEVHGASAAWFDRPEGESTGVEPHVDAIPDPQWNAGGTIWFALDQVNKSNGCVHYLRHSHKNNYPAVIPIPGIDTDSDEVFVAELNPGDIVIHHALTVHWSGGNRSGQPRRAVSYFYFGAGATSNTDA